MVVVPAATPVARPEALIVAVAVLVELHRRLAGQILRAAIGVGSHRRKLLRCAYKGRRTRGGYGD